MPGSIPGVVDIDIVPTDGKPIAERSIDLVVEIPHGATRTTDFTALQARLTSPLPDDLVDFFHVNTDAGAPELAVAMAHELVKLRPGTTIAIARCRIPRTFIDCNRRMDATAVDFKAGKVTPGLMPWITTDHDRELLRGLYDQYVGAVAALAALAPQGAMLMLHTYAPRSVDIEVGPDIVTGLRRAYLPEVEPTWKLRPEIDIIGRALDGTDHVPPGVVEALRAHGLDPQVSATYPMHPSTLAYDHVIARPGRAACIEFRRDLLADPFVPFAQQVISPEKVAKLALPLADAVSKML